jgi:thioredoxin 1
MKRLLPIIILGIAAWFGCAVRPDATKVDPPTDSWFQSEVVQSNTPVLVDFNATWCGPCQALKPSIEKLAEQYDGRLKVVPIDVDERGDLAAHYGVSSIPRLMILKGGKVIANASGGMTYEQLESWVSKNL